MWDDNMKKLAILLIIVMLLAIPYVSASKNVDTSVIGGDGAINSLFQDKNVNDKLIKSFNNDKDFRELVFKLNSSGLLDSSNLMPEMSLDLDFNLDDLFF